jgi:undecaprenyl phosphate-alpha-L-ara4FN deformylase
VRSIALKVDVDTLRGTLDGAPRLAALLGRHSIPATFLFSLGPDHTGRALRRVFRRGFLSKVRRTSVVSNYGLRTLLYGTLLPGPDIGARGAQVMRAIGARGFEVGVHAHDHVAWQDQVAGASLEWTRERMRRAVEAFQRVFGFAPRVHGAAGWQMNAHVPQLEREFGFEVASDTRGSHAFLPAGGGVLQLPTTLPTLDEIIGRDAATADDAIDTLLACTHAAAEHVFTLHAELEGGAYLPQFERLLLAWRDAGYRFVTLGDAARAIPPGSAPQCAVTTGTVAGRSGELAIQARG